MKLILFVCLFAIGLVVQSQEIYIYIKKDGKSLVFKQKISGIDSMIFMKGVIPTLTTSPITKINSIDATSGGTVIKDGYSTLTAEGVCWSSSDSLPTIANSKTSIVPDSKTPLIFTSTFQGLIPETKYYVRAYATNGIGTGYGDLKTFTTSKITDVDGNIYNAILIGTQVWMDENLKTTKFNDTTAIPIVTNSTEWDNTNTAAYCWYNNDPLYINPYGALYNWHAVNNDKLCPLGWHVPSVTDWETLKTELGNSAGDLLKEIGFTHWNSLNLTATNSSKFTALPGGYRKTDVSFSQLGIYGHWWTSTEKDITDAAFYSMYSGGSVVSTDNTNKNSGFSVRCIRD